MKHNDAQVLHIVRGSWEIKASFTFGSENLTLMSRAFRQYHNKYCFALRFNAPSDGVTTVRLTAYGFGLDVQTAMEDLCLDVAHATNLPVTAIIDRLQPLADMFVWVEQSREGVMGDDSITI